MCADVSGRPCASVVGHLGVRPSSSSFFGFLFREPMELWDVGSYLVPQSPAGLAAGALRGVQSRMAHTCSSERLQHSYCCHIPLIAISQSDHTFFFVREAVRTHVLVSCVCVCATAGGSISDTSAKSPRTHVVCAVRSSRSVGVRLGCAAVTSWHEPRVA